MITQFNLLYLDEKGIQVKAYRKKSIRRIVFEDGREHGHTYVSTHMKFIGYVKGKGPENYSPRFEINPVNGFKVRMR